LDSAQHWASVESEDDLGRRVLERVQKYASNKAAEKVLDRQSRAYQYFFGFDSSGAHATSQVLRDGEQGELAAIRVNHSRPLVNTLLNLIVAPKIVWSPKATNIDYDSLRELDLCAATLEYFWREKDVARFATQALEQALVFSEGFVLVEWQDDAGAIVAVDPGPETPPAPPTEPAPPAPPEQNAAESAPVVDIPVADAPEGLAPEAASPLGFPAKPVRAGDLVFRNIAPWDVIRDPTRQSWDQLDWVIIRKWVNRFDLAAQYPAKREAILHAPAELDSDSANDIKSASRDETQDTDDIPVYLLFHEVTPAVPEGRQALVLQNGVTLKSGPLEYKTAQGQPFIPLYRVSAGEVAGTPFGYTPYWDILGVQELMDSLHTSIASNQSTLATQLIAVPEGSEIPIDDLAGGMKVIYFDPALGPQAVPQGINLTRTPSEVFNYVASLKTHQELIFGLNSVVRGEAQSGEMSGSALALLQSQALQQSSVTQANWLRMVEAIGTCVVDLINTRASVPMKIALAGKANASLLPEADIDTNSFTRIRRVHVEIGNPLSQTSAGRAEMAKDLMTLGLVKTPEQYQEVLSTGRLEMLTQGTHHELLLIRGENEQLANGEVPPVADLDNHPLHVQEHKNVLANPQVRKNKTLLQNVLLHIQEHQVAFYTTDPALLLMAGMQPPAPLDPGLGMGPPPGGPPPPPGGPGPAGPPPPAGAGNPAAGKTPNMPQPPTQPATGQKWDPTTAGGAVQGRVPGA
jgi:hypothetical protein